MATPTPTSTSPRNISPPTNPNPTLPSSANPSTARLAAGTDSATPAVLRSTSTRSSPGLERRASRQERLDEIFSTARKRKLMLDQEYPELASGEEDNPLSRERSPTGRRKASGMDVTRGIEGGGGETSSADEETYVFRQTQGGDNGRNYQSTNIQTSSRPKREGLRSRPSTTSIRRRGRISEVNQHLGEEGEDEHEGWWARLLSNYGSLELENKGSVARDHLALERTFLAWLRTSLAFASIGIAITQLFRLNITSASTGGADPYKHLRQMGKPLGATFLGISIVMLGVGFHRYFESQHWIIRGKFPASRGSIALVALITLLLSVTSLIIIIVVEPASARG